MNGTAVTIEESKSNSPYYAVFVTETGLLRSLGTVLADPLPKDLTAKVIDPPGPNDAWNATLRIFETIPTPVDPYEEEKKRLLELASASWTTVDIASALKILLNSP